VDGGTAPGTHRFDDRLASGPGAGAAPLAALVDTLKDARRLIGQRVNLEPWGNGGGGGLIIRLQAEIESGGDIFCLAELADGGESFTWELDGLSDACQDLDAFAAATENLSRAVHTLGTGTLSLDRTVLSWIDTLSAPGGNTLGEVCAGIRLHSLADGPCGATAAERAAEAWLAKAAQALRGNSATLRLPASHSPLSSHERLDHEAFVADVVARAKTPFPPGPIGAFLMESMAHAGVSVVADSGLAALVRHGPWPTYSPAVMACSRRMPDESDHTGEGEARSERKNPPAPDEWT